MGSLLSTSWTGSRPIAAQVASLAPSPRRSWPANRVSNPIEVAQSARTLKRPILEAISWAPAAGGASLPPCRHSHACPARPSSQAGIKKLRRRIKLRCQRFRFGRPDRDLGSFRSTSFVVRSGFCRRGMSWLRFERHRLPWLWLRSLGPPPLPRSHSPCFSIWTMAGTHCYFRWYAVYLDTTAQVGC